MLHKKYFFLTILVFILLAPAVAHAGVSAQNTDIYTSSGTVNVNYIRVDLGDPLVEIKPVIANDSVGTTESLASMAGRAGATAAINGTFFNSYSDMQPQGALQLDGIHHHLSDGATVGITADNKVAIQRIKNEIEGGINGSWQYPNNWYAWGINHNIDSPDAIEIYTPSFGGGAISPNATVVVVENGRVTDITSGQVDVPTGGYLIGFGPLAADISSRFKIGDRVSYRVVSRDENGTLIKDMVKSISAGPLLVTNGEIAVDFAKEGISDPKLTTNGGARSFIGLTSDNALVMGTVPGATIWQLAETAQALGLVSAMNLDGGASSGLYYNGSYLTAPGRDLSNCLAIIYHEEPPVQINVNGTLIPSTAYIMPPGITMVPVRGVLEKMGATVEWNQYDQSVSVRLGKNSVTLHVDSNLATINGTVKTMQYAAEITNDRTYIPLRFVSENLGAQVNWDGNTNTVYVRASQSNVSNAGADELMSQAGNAMESGNTSAAIELFKKALEVDPALTDAYTKLGNLYFEKQDFSNASAYLEKAHELNPNDSGITGTLGWAYYSSLKYSESISAFEEMLVQDPTSAEANFGLGLCYSAWNVKDYDNARIYLQKAISLDPSGPVGENAMNILSSLP